MSPSIATDQLQPVLRDLRVAPAVGVVEMQGGSAPTFQIDLADGERLVLKTYLDELLTLPAKEAFAAAQLQGLGIPVTQYLLMDESRTRLPFRFAITNYLPGSAARNLMDDPGISEVYRQMGALLQTSPSRDGGIWPIGRPRRGQTRRDERRVHACHNR